MADLTLSAYQAAERRAAVDDSHRGFTVHAVVTVLVSLGLIAINVFLADEFPWAIFPVVGMGIGLFAHWHFGVANVESTVRSHQRDIERIAA